MSKVQHSSKEANARATLPDPGPKRAAMVVQTQQLAEIIKKAPDYDASPPIKRAVSAWVAAADIIDEAEQKLKAAHLTMSALVAAQAKNVAAWKRTKRSVLAAVDSASDGSAAAIKQWGFAVHSRAPLASTNEAPSGLRAAYTKDFVLHVRWDRVRGDRGYLLQMGDGTPQGWAVAIPCTKTLFAPQGLSPGQRVAFRVAVLRKDGQSAWSDVLAITTR